MAVNLLNTADVAAMLGVQKGTVHQWRLVGSGPPFIKATHKVVRYRLADVERWLESRLVNSTTEADDRGL